MQRQGECNLCGQCCGGEGGPQRCPPIPFLNLNRATMEIALEDFPLGRVVGVPVGDQVRDGVSLVVRVKGQTYNVAWVPGVGLVKGTVADHVEECPLLMPDPGDGTRPCALVGSRWQDIWDALCKDQPPIEKTQEMVERWAYWYPGCGYWWE